MATLPLPPLAIDADPSSQLPAYSGAALRASVAALTACLSGSDIRPRNGVLSQGAFRVSVSGSNVMVAAGSAVVAYATGAYIATIETSMVAGTLASANATNGRIDRVVLRIDDPSNGGKTDRTGSVEVITGTPAANPTAPAVSGTSVYLELAQISVPRSGGGSAAVTDKRTFTAAAGGVVLTGPSTLASLSTQPGFLGYDTGANTLNVRTASAWKRILTQDDQADTGLVTSGIFATSAGWSISLQRGKKLNGVVFYEIRVKRTGATITAPASGNIPNEKLAIFNEGWRPLITSSAVTNSYGPMGTGGVSPNDYSVYLASMAPGAVINTGDEINMSGSFAGA